MDKNYGDTLWATDKDYGATLWATLWATLEVYRATLWATLWVSLRDPACVLGPVWPTRAHLISSVELSIA